MTPLRTARRRQLAQSAAALAAALEQQAEQAFAGGDLAGAVDAELRAQALRRIEGGDR